MAKKSNINARAIDLTSYTFVQTCGGCHPGGGPAEYDRNGKRYDLFAADPKNSIISGGNNNFDGDYYKAGWAESGVLEADCLMCHMPEYGYGLRKQQVKALNFRWAAILFVDVKKDMATVRKFDIRAIPTQVFFDKAGKEVWRHAGFLYQKTIEGKLNALVGK